MSIIYIYVKIQNVIFKTNLYLRSKLTKQPKVGLNCDQLLHLGWRQAGPLRSHSVPSSGETLCCDNRHTINRNRSAVPEKSRLIGANRQPRYLCLNHILGQNDCFLFGRSSNMAQKCHLQLDFANLRGVKINRRLIGAVFY